MAYLETPHMHLCFVPITPDDKLSAKDYLQQPEIIIRVADRLP